MILAQNALVRVLQASNVNVGDMVDWLLESQADSMPFYKQDKYYSLSLNANFTINTDTHLCSDDMINLVNLVI